jgi:YD repeat-containing protein
MMKQKILASWVNAICMAMVVVLSSMSSTDIHAQSTVRQEVAKPVFTWYLQVSGYPQISGEYPDLGSLKAAYVALVDAEHADCIARRATQVGPMQCFKRIVLDPYPSAPNQYFSSNGIPQYVSFKGKIITTFGYPGYPDQTIDQDTLGATSIVRCPAGGLESAVISNTPPAVYVNCVDYSVPAKIEPQACKAPEADAKQGNPIEPASGQKHLDEVDYIDNNPHPLNMLRTYRSRLPNVLPAVDAPSDLGGYWSHSYFGRFQDADDSTGYLRSVVVGGSSEARRYAPAAMTGVAYGISDTSISLNPLNDGIAKANGVWRYIRNEDNSSFNFMGPYGQIQSHTQRNGWTMNYSYNGAGQLSQVTNQFGRSMGFAYNSAGLMTSVTPPDGRAITYEYDSASRLSV